jgi:hypothetical protein
MYVCMYVCMCMCVYVYVCMYVCIYVCMYACMHVCIAVGWLRYAMYENILSGHWLLDLLEAFRTAHGLDVSQKGLSPLLVQDPALHNILLGRHARSWWLLLRILPSFHGMTWGFLLCKVELRGQLLLLTMVELEGLAHVVLVFPPVQLLLQCHRGELFFGELLHAELSWVCHSAGGSALHRRFHHLDTLRALHRCEGDLTICLHRCEGDLLHR